MALTTIITTRKNATRRFLIFILFLFPIMMGSWAVMLRNASGPFWLGCNSDPSYAYMMNSLAITQGHPVGHMDHPGSTLQILGAVMLYPYNLIMGREEFVKDVLTNPEYYIIYLHLMLTCLLTISTITAGQLALKWSNDFISAFLVQFGIMASHTSQRELHDVRPEILLLILSVLFIIIIIYHDHLIRNNKNKEPAWLYGLIAGMGMALKINFAPLLFMPMILLSGIRRRIIYCGTTVVVFLILTLNSFMRFHFFKRFFLNLVNRKGYNAPIVPGSDKLQAMADGAGRLAKQCVNNEKLFFCLFIGFVATGILMLFYRFFRNFKIKNTFFLRCWIGFIVVLFFQFMLVANGPRSHTHYMTPAFGLAGLMLYISWRWPVVEFKETKIKLLKYIVIFNSMFIACIVLLALYSSIDLLLIKTPNKRDRWQQANRFKTDNNLTNNTTAYYRSSNKMFALNFGNNFAGHVFDRQLVELYPNYYYYRHVSSPKNNIYNFTSKPVSSISALIKKSGTVLLQGKIRPSLITDITKEVAFPISSEIIFKGSAEWIVSFKPIIRNFVSIDSPESVIKEFVKEAPKESEDRLRLGYAYFIRGNQAQANEILQFFENSNNAQALYLLGRCNEQIDKDKAVMFFKKAAHLDNFYIDGYYRIGKIFENSGQEAESIKYYKKTLEKAPKHAMASLSCARLANSKNPFAEHKTIADQNSGEVLGWYKISPENFKATAIDQLSYDFIIINEYGNNLTPITFAIQADVHGFVHEITLPVGIVKTGLDSTGHVLTLGEYACLKGQIKIPWLEPNEYDLNLILDHKIIPRVGLLKITPNPEFRGIEVSADRMIGYVKNSIKTLINPNGKQIRMFWNGTVVFPLYTNKGNNTLSLMVGGPFANDIAPEIKVRTQGKVLFEGYTKSPDIHELDIAFVSNGGVLWFEIDFCNNGIFKHPDGKIEDRDFIIYSAKLLPKSE